MILNSRNLKTWVEVDAKALRSNVRALKRAVGRQTRCFAVVKSNAYGHGILECARVFSNMPEIYGFAVDCIEEALWIQKIVRKKPILVLDYIPEARLPEAVKNGFHVSVYNRDAVAKLAHAAKRYRTKARMHLKIETGTYRQGILLDDLDAFLDEIRKHHPYVSIEGVYTHFADTENPASSYYKEQLEAFENALRKIKKSGFEPAFVHTAASAAAMIYPESRYGAVRLGIAMYGLYPSKEVKGAAGKKIALHPALSWKTRVAQVKDVPAKATIGYDRTFKVSHPMKIAVLPVGYWDGFDRRFSNNGEVLIRGKRAPIVGNICMNICMADVSHIKNVFSGDEVALLGRQGKEMITAEEMAERISTINYELADRINPLIPRILV